MNKTQRKKCCAVAQDVLDHIKLVNVTPGTYCDGRIPPSIPADIDCGTISAKKHIDGLSAQCRVCAMGACFLSYIRLYNKIQLDAFVDSSTTAPGENFDVDFHYIDDVLLNVFSAPQLCLIETAFERCLVNDGPVYNGSTDDDFDYSIDERCLVNDGPVYNGSTDDDFDYSIDECCLYSETNAAIAFGSKYKNKHKRLKAIMNNIIKNDGEFIPDKKLYKSIRKQHAAYKKNHKKNHKKMAVEMV